MEEGPKASQLIAAQMHPEDMTGTLLHQVSDSSKFVTGHQTLVVDGGRYFLS